jgi:hypothetical protein
VALIDVSQARRAGLRTFGDPVLYRPASGAPEFTVPLAVFTAPFEALELGAGEASISTGAPMLGVELSDFPGPPIAGDTLVRAGVTGRVTDVQRDGQGGASLRLQRFD